MEELINEMIEKGLMKIAKEDVHEASRQMLLLKLLDNTEEHTHADIFTSYIRLYQRN